MKLTKSGSLGFAKKGQVIELWPKNTDSIKKIP